MYWDDATGNSNISKEVTSNQYIYYNRILKQLQVLGSKIK